MFRWDGKVRGSSFFFCGNERLIDAIVHLNRSQSLYISILYMFLNELYHLRIVPIDILASFYSRPCVGYDVAASRRFRLGEVISVVMKHVRDIVSFVVGFRDRGRARD